MSTGLVGVAISTTGDPHRLGFLETCVRAWDRALPEDAPLFVTVDGSVEDTYRVGTALAGITESVYRVGQRTGYPHDPHRDRLGVAVNKNTGLELLRDASVEHLFLSDDDLWPLYPQSLQRHIEMPLLHSMVMWGGSRLIRTFAHMAQWTWPRGAMLYAQRSVVETVGGMDERFGIGGHEHVEWSNRIHNAGLTPAPYLSPLSYSTRTSKGAATLWHAEDMRRPGEDPRDLGARRKALTSVHRKPEDRAQIDKIMAERAGSSDFVPYRAHENSRASATLCQDLMGQGGCAVEPAKPRSET